jgi:hypothetical protein
LQRELEENNRIEEALRKEIEAELQDEPNHPIITEITDTAQDLTEPTTPKAVTIGIEQPSLRTPQESPLTEQNSLRKSTDLSQYQIGPFPHSPNDNDGNTFRAPGLPAYRTRQTSSFDESMNDYGCGAAILGNSAFRLFTLSSSSVVPVTSTHENEYNEVVAHANSYGNSHHYRFRSMSSDAHPDLGSTSSFDAIDFRTGMSGHRGLNNATKLNPGHSPTPRGSRFMMSEHRGIARVRGPLQKLSAFNTSSP